MRLPFEYPEIILQSQHILDSFRHWTGRDLIPRLGEPSEQARSLFYAPFPVLSHGTQADPLLNYGNQKALELWETDWITWVQTPSRQTAEPMVQRERSDLLQAVARQGYSEDYSGVRVSQGGRRFEINGAMVWNLLDESGKPAGQAAMFKQWQFFPERS